MFRSADSPEDDALAGRSRDQVTIDRHREYLAGLGRVGQWRPASQDADDLGGHMLDLERHATGGATRAEVDADDYWQDQQSGMFDSRPYDDEVA